MAKMRKELPLYIFLRNTIVLCLLFFTISFVIIERGKIQRGDHSIFQGIIKNKKNIRDYNSPDFTSIEKKDQNFQYSNNLKQDSTETVKQYNTNLIAYKNIAKQVANEIDL